jgi:hypothetical protein
MRGIRYITPPQEQHSLHKQYVICEGMFRSGWKGHTNMFSGAISNVVRLEPWIPAIGR